MAARIVHFGVDESYRTAVLARAGFEIEDCDSSLPRLANALRKSTAIDAVILSEAEGQDYAAKEAAKLARSACKAPVILFQSAKPSREYPQIDLVIPSLTEPAVWLSEIHEMIQRSRQVVSESQAIRNESRMLVQQSSDLRRQTTAAGERSEYLRSELRKMLDEDDKRREEVGK
jgi:hypothetical protein